MLQGFSLEVLFNVLIHKLGCEQLHSSMMATCKQYLWQPLKDHVIRMQ